ncbi:hypothetical protein NWFMUON74_25990 [Nocardia wallacei]|uniref:Uncharacterized protein n=1 Tax=Nocardia wallacei TaxID=480035 RepID=A0A7G1KHX4_9NOCA|nr:hypothetical protein NWFMUON74_25990 [Nocardia wallacei]
MPPRCDQLLGQGENIAAQLRGVELLVPLGERGLGVRGNVRVVEKPLIRGAGGVVAPDHLGPDPVLGHEQLARREEVSMQPQLRVNLVAQQQLSLVGGAWEPCPRQRCGRGA